MQTKNNQILEIENMSQVPYLRIATEEAFAPPEMLDIYSKILAKKT